MHQMVDDNSMSKPYINLNELVARWILLAKIMHHGNIVCGLSLPSQFHGNPCPNDKDNQKRMNVDRFTKMTIPFYFQGTKMSRSE